MRRQPQARGTKARSRIESFRELEERLRKRRESGNVRLDTKATYIGKKIFEISGLRKRFGDRIILNGLDYRFARYEKMGIIGDNGTGKSTFIRMLLGLEPPDAGHRRDGPLRLLCATRALVRRERESDRCRQ